MQSRRLSGFGTEKDRLQPALLDRLTDHEPTRRTEQADAVYVTESRLRGALLRDLGWLLNASNASGQIDFSGLAHAEKSTLNYGMNPLAGQLLSDLDWKDVEANVSRAILAFLGAAIGLMSVLLLGAPGGPVLAAQISLFQALGYLGLCVSIILILRVINALVRDRLV